jgi:hypothetical protein
VLLQLRFFFLHYRQSMYWLPMLVSPITELNPSSPPPPGLENSLKFRRFKVFFKEFLFILFYFCVCACLMHSQILMEIERLVCNARACKYPLLLGRAFWNWVFLLSLAASYLQAGDASLSRSEFTLALRQYSSFIGMLYNGSTSVGFFGCHCCSCVQHQFFLTLITQYVKCAYLMQHAKPIFFFLRGVWNCRVRTDSTSA